MWVCYPFSINHPQSHPAQIPFDPTYGPMAQLELRAPGEELAPFALSEAFASGSSVGAKLCGFWDPHHISWLCFVDGSGIRLKKTVKQRSQCVYTSILGTKPVS